MSNHVLHAMYINFSMIHCRFTVLTFIALFNLLNMMYNSDFINTFTTEQFFISSSDKISVMYEA